MTYTEENCLNGKGISNSSMSTGTTSEVVYNHYKNQLIKSVVDFFTSYDIGFISRTLSNSAFFATNPDRSIELDKQELAEILIDQIELLANISEIYSRFYDYYAEAKKLKP